MDGGGNDDRIYGSNANDTIRGGATGRDILKGEGGNDRIYGQADNDELYGQAGDDRLDGGDGAAGSRAGRQGLLRRRGGDDHGHRCEAERRIPRLLPRFRL